MKNLICILFGVLIFCLPASSLDFGVYILGDLGGKQVTVTAIPNNGFTGPDYQTLTTNVVTNSCYFTNAYGPGGLPLWRGTITPTLVGYTFTPVNRVVIFQPRDTAVYFLAQLVIGVKETPTATSSSLNIVYRNGIVIQGLTAGIPYEVTAFDLQGKILYHLYSVSARSSVCLPWKSKASCIIQATQNKTCSIRRF
jgi:hypothetical protein